MILFHQHLHEYHATMCEMMGRLSGAEGERSGVPSTFWYGTLD
jgi:hypothetical protein